MGGGAVNLARILLWHKCGCRLIRQCLQVVAQDLSVKILQDRLLRQAGNMFQAEPMLESFETFFDGPSQMV